MWTVQPKDLSKADALRDWVTLWPEKYATSSEAITFEGGSNCHPERREDMKIM